MTTEPQTKEEKLAQLAHQRITLEGKRNEVARQLEETDREIAAVMGGYARNVPAGNLRVTFTGPNRTFNKQRFMQDYPRELNPHLYAPAKPAEPDLDLSQVAPALKEKYMEEGTGAAKITIK